MSDRPTPALDLTNDSTITAGEIVGPLVLVVIAIVVGIAIVLLVHDLGHDFRRRLAEAHRIITAMNDGTLAVPSGLVVSHPDDPDQDTMPVRLQQARVAGWRKPENAVIVGRGTRWGNPWRAGERIAMPDQDGSIIITPELAVALYAAYVTQRGWLDEAADELAGRDLICWCRIGEPCHADWLLEVVNARAMIRALSTPHAA